MPSPAPRLALAASLLALAAPAAADDAVRVELVPKALLGKGHPALVVHTNVPVRGLSLALSGEELRFAPKVGALGAGRSHRFELPLGRARRVRLTGELVVHLPDGEGRLPLALEVEALGPMAVEVLPDSLDLEAGKLQLKVNRPLTRVTVAVTSDTGTPLGTSEVRFDPPLPAGEAGAVAFERKPGAVLSLVVTAFDDGGFYAAVELSPWRLDIPHEEINFATGSAEIPPAEAPKLAASAERVKAAIADYGHLAKLRLFIGGHTDTVGAAAANLELSAARAKSIGRWFRGHGIRIPIEWAGFGETRPYVETADEVDEPKNRRAEYIVAVDAPRPGFRPL